MHSPLIILKQRTGTRPTSHFSLLLYAICLIIIASTTQIKSSTDQVRILDKRAPADTKYVKTSTMPTLQQPWSDGDIQNIEIEGICMIPEVYKVELLVLL